MVSRVNWYNKESVVSHAKTLAKAGNTLVVYKRTDRKSYGMCHVSNLSKRRREAHADQAKLSVEYRTDGKSLRY